MKLPVLVTRVPPSATPTSLLESLMTKYGLPGHTARDYCLVTRTDQVRLLVVICSGRNIRQLQCNVLQYDGNNICRETLPWTRLACSR